MQNYNDYLVQLDNLKEIASKAIEAGYPVTVQINGEYYTVTTRGQNTEKGK